MNDEGCDWKVAEIDFFKSDWQQSLRDHLATIDVILVADVVYDEAITRAFFQTISSLFSFMKNPSMFVAIERRTRINEEGEIEAPNFELFRRLLENFGRDKSLKVTQLNIDFQQYFKSYSRVNEIHLWRVAK